ncbi:hypothetical protein SteCoe_13179 [Stentor coeruleus]|uniref:Uncharacterized protein n=1 Tax=Stentor coeruleus TaxID=5963 RepID=A0A1R2C8Z9_9CILI|nr:hypothetical protein SteCoe_13179 [Stentor coeruleus]
MDNDIYAFIGIKPSSNLKKSSSSSRINTLDRRASSSARINTLKIRQKAHDMKEMRSVPQINEKSRKIAENLKRERQDIITKHEEKSYELFQEPIRLSVNILKQLEKFESPTPQQPDLKSMNIQERSKYWKEQKDKKLEEQRKVKKDQELNGCTFKPKKVQQQEFDVVKPPSGLKLQEKKQSNMKIHNEKTHSLKTASSLGRLDSQNVESESLAMLLKGKDFIKPAPNGTAMKNTNCVSVISKNPDYQALSPARGVRIKQGFLSDLAKPKGK